LVCTVRDAVNADIGEAVNEMFVWLSSSADSQSYKFKNGENNLLYSIINHSLGKDDMQEVQVALLETQWYKPETRNNAMCMGFSVNTKK
jgi:hypothetical protein